MDADTVACSLSATALLALAGLALGLGRALGGAANRVALSARGLGELGAEKMLVARFNGLKVESVPLNPRNSRSRPPGQRPSRRRQSRAERNLPAAVTNLPFLRL